MCSSTCTKSITLQILDPLQCRGQFKENLRAAQLDGLAVAWESGVLQGGWCQQDVLNLHKLSHSKQAAEPDLQRQFTESRNEQEQLRLAGFSQHPAVKIT